MTIQPTPLSPSFMLFWVLHANSKQNRSKRTLHLKSYQCSPILEVANRAIWLPHPSKQHEVNNKISSKILSGHRWIFFFLKKKKKKANFLCAPLLFQLPSRREMRIHRPSIPPPQLSAVLHAWIPTASQLPPLSLEHLFSHYAIRGEKTTKRHKPCLWSDLQPYRLKQL